MSAQHTPGPWAVRATPESSYQDFIVQAGKWAIASIDTCTSTDIEKANARLIAAAPDLLAALCNLLDAPIGSWPFTAKQDARNAIAKATGETA